MAINIRWSPTIDGCGRHIDDSCSWRDCDRSTYRAETYNYLSRNQIPVVYGPRVCAEHDPADDGCCPAVGFSVEASIYRCSTTRLAGRSPSCVGREAAAPIWPAFSVSSAIACNRLRSTLLSALRGNSSTILRPSGTL